jgi:hypothetical protein
LPVRPVERLPKVILGHGRGPLCALQQKKLALDAQKLGNQPAFFDVLAARDRVRREPVEGLRQEARPLASAVEPLL